MRRTTKTPRTLALVASLALILSAMAVPAMAKEDERPARPSDGPRDRYEQMCQDPANETVQERCDRYEESQKHAEQQRQKAQERRDAAQERREAAKQKYEEKREAYREHCEEPANETVEKRCENAKRINDGAFKARREAHALMGAVRAVEHRIAKLEMMEYRIQDALAEQNITDEKKQELEQKLVRIDEAQEKLVDRLAHLYERIDALHQKWKEVREHVEKKQAQRDRDAGDDDAGDGDEAGGDEAGDGDEF